MKPSSSVHLIGIAGIVWFSALNQGAYDLWASCVLFLLTTILLSMYAWTYFRKPHGLDLSLAIPVICLLATVLLSFPHAYDKGTLILEFWGWFFAFSIFYLLLNNVKNEGDLNFFLKAIGLVCIPLAGICLWQQLTGHPDSWGHWEIHGTLINSLVLSGFALNCLFLLWETACAGSRTGRAIVISCIIILALGRSTWALTCLMIGFLYYYRSFLVTWIKNHRRAGLSVILTIAVLVACMIGWKVLMHSGPYKGSSRLHYWLVAYKIWRQVPLTGVGLGGYATAYPYFRDSRFQATLFAHSFPLQWLAETGVAGTTATLVLLITFIRQYRSAPAGHGKGTAENSYITALIVTLLFSLISINLDYLLNKVMLLITVGASLAGRRVSLSRVKPLWVGVFSVSLWLVSPFWLRMLFASQEYVRAVDFEAVGNMDSAKQSHLRAVSLDPYLSESFYHLYRIHLQLVQRDGKNSTTPEAIHFLEMAYESKKSLDYLIALQPYRSTNGRLSSRSLTNNPL